MVDPQTFSEGFNLLVTLPFFIDLLAGMAGRPLLELVDKFRAKPADTSPEEIKLIIRQRILAADLSAVLEKGIARVEKEQALALRQQLENPQFQISLYEALKRGDTSRQFLSLVREKKNEDPQFMPEWTYDQIDGLVPIVYSSLLDALFQDEPALKVIRQHLGQVSDQIDTLQQTLGGHSEQSTKEYQRIFEKLVELSSQSSLVNEDESLRRALERLDSLPLKEIPSIATLPQGSRMPYSPNPLFVGREDDLKKLAKTLKGGETAAIGQVAAVSGLGGIGKTQLAVEFVHRYGQFFAGIFWLNFCDDRNVEAEIVDCGGPGRLELYKEDERLEQAEKCKRVTKAWQSGPPWLLVFDNCEEEEPFRHWRPSSGACRVLLTSRQDRWDQALGISNLHLGVLTPEQSTELLRKYFPELTDEDAASIATELGHLPLALALAGSYLQDSRHDVTPAAFLAEIQKPDLLDHPALAQQGRDLNNHERNVARTFLMSYDRLRAADPVDGLALLLLARLACLAPGTAIPRELARAALLEGEAPDLTILANFSAVVGRLCQLGLLDELENGSLLMHRLIMAFARPLADDEAENSVEEALTLISFRVSEKGLPQPMVPLVPHLRQVVKSADHRESPHTATLCGNLAYHLEKTARYAEAEPLMRRALVIDEARFGQDHPEVACDLNNLAQLLQDTNRLVEAEPLTRRALAIDEASFGQDHPEVARDLNNLATLLKAMNRLTEAEPLMRRVAHLMEKSFGEGHPKVAMALNNLASLLQDTNRLTEAESLMRRALAIDEVVYGPDHPEVAIRLNNLAALLKATNRLTEAEPLMRRALAIDEASYGKDHPKVAIRLNNLALLLQDTNRLAEAEPLMRRALATDEASFGQDHPEVACDLNSLVRLLKATNRLAEAEPLMSRALNILLSFTRNMEHVHPHLQAAIGNYAVLLKDLGRSREEIMAILQKMVPELFEKEWPSWVGKKDALSFAKRIHSWKLL